MSEEIDNAAINVPRAIFTTMILNGATGFAMVLAVLFCIDDIGRVIVSHLFFLTVRFNPDLTSLVEDTDWFPVHTGILRRD